MNTETTATWPYDAAQNDPLTAHRIPVVNEHHQWMYIVWFDEDSPARPDDRETAMLVSFLNEYIEYWYTGSYKAKLRSRPFDIDGGANGIGFIKYADGSWGYRRRSWEHSYRPAGLRTYDVATGRWDRKSPAEPMTLLQVMDRCQAYGSEPNPRWEAWKAAHPEVFGAVA